MLKRCISIIMVLCMLLAMVTASGVTSVSAALAKQEIGVNQVYSNRVRVTCKPVKNATHYEVRYSRDTSFSNAKTATFKTNLCTVKSLTLKKYYYFQARAYKLSGKTKTYLTKYSSTRGIYIQPNYTKVTAKLNYTVKNLPNARVIQGFYIDTVDNCLYTTQVTPVYDDKGNKVREDTVISKCPINEKGEAVCESYIYIKNGGHGVTLQGYRDSNNKLRFFIGCDYGTAPTSNTAASVVNISYNEKYANKYDSSKRKFRNADGEIVSCPTTRKASVDYKTTVFNSGANAKTFNNARIRNVYKLLNSNEKYSRFDLVRSSSGKYFVVIKYIESGKTYTKVFRISENLDTVARKQKKASYFSALTATCIHNKSRYRTFISNCWQSTGVYGKGNKPSILLNGNVGFEGTDYTLSFNDIEADRSYNVEAYTSGYKGVEEIEGMQIIGKKVYFAHKAVNSADGSRIITIQSFDLAV